MNLAIHPATKLLVATQECDRITRLVEAIDTATEAKRRATEEAISDASEFLLWEVYNAAEERLVVLMLDAGLRSFLQAALEVLREEAGGAA